MRVRARPFTSDSFHGNNPQVTCIQCCTPLFDLLSLVLMQDAVLSIPGRPEWDLVASAFDGADQSHREQMWLARMALFCKCNFRRREPGSPLIPCTLAFVNWLREFTVPEAREFPYFPYTLNSD